MNILKTETKVPTTAYNNCHLCQEYVSISQGYPRAMYAYLTDDTMINLMHNKCHVPLTENDFENYPIKINHNPLSEEAINYSQLESNARLAIYKLYKTLEKNVLQFPTDYDHTSICVDSIRSTVRNWNKNPNDALLIDPISGNEKLSYKDTQELRFFGRLVSLF